MEITYSTGTYYGEAEILHRWFAIEDGERVGELYVSMTTGVIMNVEVERAHRGEGVARALYEAATAVMTVKHAPEWACTPEGAAFATAMGGGVATNEEMAAMGVATPEMEY